MCGLLKCLSFPLEKHGNLTSYRESQYTILLKFICTSHAINQSLRSWNLLCHYSLTLFFFQILILLVNFAKSWLRRLFGMPGKSWTKKSWDFSPGIFMILLSKNWRYGQNRRQNWMNWSHCSKSSFFVQKFNFDFPRKLSIFWVEKLVKMLWFWTF